MGKEKVKGRRKKNEKVTVDETKRNETNWRDTTSPLWSTLSLVAASSLPTSGV